MVKNRTWKVPEYSKGEIYIAGEVIRNVARVKKYLK